MLRKRRRVADFVSYEQYQKAFPELSVAPFLGGVDSNFSTYGYDESELRILIQVTGNFFDKQSSCILNLLSENLHLAEEHSGARFFLDVAYQFPDSDIKVLRKYGLSEAFGWFSGRPFSDFDVILISCPVHYEIPLTYLLLRASDIPVFHHERLRGKYPLVIGGGNQALLFSIVQGFREGSLFDVAYLGDGQERLPELAETLLDMKRSGVLSGNRLACIRSLVTQYDNIFYSDGYAYFYGRVDGVVGKVEGITRLELYSDAKARMTESVGVDVRTHDPITGEVEAHYTKEYRGDLSRVWTDAEGWALSDTNPLFDPKIHGYVLRAIVRKYEWLPMTVRPFIAFDLSEAPVYGDWFFNVDNEKSGRVSLRISEACSGGSQLGPCRFCNSGNEAGPYREYSFERLQGELRRLLRNSAANTVTFVSWNSNYYSRLFDLFNEVAKRASDVTVLTVRPDFVSESTDYAKMIKGLKSRQLSVAMEGFSERLRNGLLNKCLSEEQIYRAAENVLITKPQRMKFNLLMTGRETAEDFAEFKNVLQRLNELKESYGVGAQIVFSITTLIQYPTTPLRWMGRYGVAADLIGNTTVRVLIRELRGSAEFQIRGKIGHVCQQIFCDFGRLFCNPNRVLLDRLYDEGRTRFQIPDYEEMCDLSFNSIGLPTDGKPSDVSNEDLQAPRAAWRDTTGLRRSFFTRERPVDELFETDLFKLVPESVVERGYANVGAPVRYCLKCDANPEPKCLGCGMCPSGEWAKEHAWGRSYGSERCYEDVIESARNNRPQSSLRVIYRIPDASEIHRHRWKLVENRYVASQILRQHDGLADSFRSIPVRTQSNYGAALLDAPDCFTGYFSFVMDFRMGLSDLSAIDFTSIIQRANQEIGLGAIQAVYPLPINMNRGKEEKYRLVYGFKTERFHDSELLQRFQSYGGRIRKTPALSGFSGDPWISVPTSEIRMVVGVRDGVTHGNFIIPSNINPILFLVDVFDMSVTTAKSAFHVECLQVDTEIDVLCGHCGVRLGSFDILRNRVRHICSECLMKSFFVRRSK